MSRTILNPLEGIIGIPALTRSLDPFKKSLDRNPWIDEYTKIFFYREINGISDIEEIKQNAGTEDCQSDYCIILDGYEFPSNFKIILGTDT